MQPAQYNPAGTGSGSGASVAAPLTFLVADDEITNRLILQAILEQDGHRVVMAEDGEQALAVYERERPDVVLMDVMMPRLDGYEATRRIKALAGEAFVPVIFLTALTEDVALARCVEAGGDDFLIKPCNRIILLSKIDALLRIREMHVALQARNAEIAQHHERLHLEYMTAEKVLAKVMHRGCLDMAGIHYLLSPMSIFNGDLLLAARVPSGGVRILLGDFTSHGMSAAVGAMPVAEIFYTMSAKGCSMSEIVAEINNKLKQILPADMFLAAALVEIDCVRYTLTVWNGGIPDLLLYRQGRDITHLFASRHLPLGILDSHQLDRTVEIVPIATGSRLCMYTDGLTDARNASGERFGEEKLKLVISGNRDPQPLFDSITTALAAFRANAEHSDDLTVAEIDCDVLVASMEMLAPVQTGVHRSSATWHMTFDFDLQVWRSADPLPTLVQILTDIQGLYAHKERLYAILGELLSNALEHGLLGLNSALKRDPFGFAQYYAERAVALDMLQRGSIHIDLQHTPQGDGGRLVIQVIDSGPGFDHGRAAPVLHENTAHSGRGIPLVRTLCQEFRYHGRGNHVEAVYTWP